MYSLRKPRGRHDGGCGLLLAMGSPFLVYGVLLLSPSVNGMMTGPASILVDFFLVALVLGYLKLLFFPGWQGRRRLSFQGDGLRFYVDRQLSSSHSLAGRRLGQHAGVVYVEMDGKWRQMVARQEFEEPLDFVTFCRDLGDPPELSEAPAGARPLDGPEEWRHTHPLGRLNC